ncbi:UNKNOWN [Stylonychia lemnae]|uniref:Uncharacterized protein n=1 Tax=Stylonychia lemnae TaxID=5949 RepID=A0A078B7G5_STYLE|nr:UNKNOWN [Stylonychia lemnae]|eukprot:CDW89478.1 UNKNOWN [Stylonychia lemnae]
MNSMKKLILYLGNRWRLKIHAKEIIAFTFQRFYLCCLKKRGKDRPMLWRKINLYNQGVNMISEEFDAVNFIDKMRKLDLFLSLFLNKNQNFLLKFQKKHLIQSNDLLSSDEEDKSSFNQFIRKYTQSNYQKNQPKQYERKLEDILNVYTKLDEIPLLDKKIINGLLTKKPLDILERTSNSSQQKKEVKSNRASGYEFNKYQIGSQQNSNRKRLLKDKKFSLGFIHRQIFEGKSRSAQQVAEVSKPKQFKKRSHNDITLKAKKITTGLKEIILTKE